jgi:transglutaminase-like putative cysteine protease
MQKTLPRLWDWQTAALFMAMIILVSGRLVMTNWTGDLVLAQGAAILGAGLGLALGVSQFSVWGRRCLAVLYTPFILGWLLINLATGAEDLPTRLVSLGGRVLYALGQLFRAEEVNDPLLFVALACLVFWSIGVFSAQAVLHPRRTWEAVLPSSLLLVLIQFYDSYPPERIWGVGVYFATLLLLFGRKNYLQNSHAWRDRGIFTGSEPEVDINRSVVFVTLFLVFLAWVLPTPASALPAAARWWRENNQPFRNAQERIGKALAALSSQQPPPVERYGDTIALGSNADQGESLLFRVRAPSGNLQRHYWRARVYDAYADGRWLASDLQTRPFLPESEESLPVPDVFGEPGQFEVEWFFAAQSTLVVPPGTIWVSRPSVLMYAPANPGLVDVNGLRADPVLAPGERYQVRSLPQNPTVVELRQAGDDYPQWVLERYLNLPEDFSPRIAALALSLTNDLETPYDKTERITQYLRRNITYSESVPAALPGADVMERFLFGWQRGYCTYYASAEVLMLRAVGIPARLAVGYAQGERSGGLYVVRSRDAHAWPEVYFPGIGWVEFEPTGNQPPLIRPSGVERPPQDPAAQPTPERDIPQFNDEDILPLPLPTGEDSSTLSVNFSLFRAVLVWIIIVAVVALALYGLWRLHERIPFQNRALQAVTSLYRRRGRDFPNWLQNWQRWSSLTDVERAFHAINQSINWLRQPQPHSITPVERVQLLKKLMPEIADEIDVLAAEHEKTLYGPQPGSPELARQSARKIRFYTLRFLFQRLF